MSETQTEQQIDYAKLYGNVAAHDDMASGDYTSPDEYSKQGDTRVVRDLMFSFLVARRDPVGNMILTPVEVGRDVEVTVDQIGLVALRKGEENHSFYTTSELERIRSTGDPRTPVAPDSNVTELGEYELSEWLQTPLPDTGKPPTINQVLERVGDDKELAHRMLQAENIATDGDARKGLEAGLTEVIQNTE